MKRLIPFLFFAACSTSESSRKTLDDAGYADIQITGWAPFGCGKDFFSTGFRATNIRGKTVEGTVCCGLLKNCTIRH